jgi:hypothetical protein
VPCRLWGEKKGGKGGKRGAGIEAGMDAYGELLDKIGAVNEATEDAFAYGADVRVLDPAAGRGAEAAQQEAAEAALVRACNAAALSCCTDVATLRLRACRPAVPHAWSGHACSQHCCCLPLVCASQAATLPWRMPASSQVSASVHAATALAPLLLFIPHSAPHSLPPCHGACPGRPCLHKPAVTDWR